MQQKIVYAGRVATSFASAADLLSHLADLDVTPKPVERLTRAIGTERVAQRDAAVAAWQARPLAEKFKAPDGVAPPELAVVFVDGGRLQIRERTATTATTEAAPDGFWEADEPPEKGFWREDKLSLLAEMKSQPCTADPCPEIPAGFLDVLRIPTLAREVGKAAAATHEASDESPGLAAGESSPAKAGAYQPPEVTHRRVLGSTQAWPVFALVVASAAWAAGFQQAKRKAFVADGASNNGRLQRRFFGSFVPVLDFIHALCYVYAAAMAGRPFAQGWECYQRWISWLWQGKVAAVIEQLRTRQGEVGLPGPGESETSVASVVARTLGYLSNHQDKMKYDQYRQQGLPITSSLMESVVKQMNYRVKGSEKFWCQQGAEAMVQLRGDHLSDDQPLEDFWANRQATATGQRPYRRAG